MGTGCATPGYLPPWDRTPIMAWIGRWDKLNIKYSFRYLYKIVFWLKIWYFMSVSTFFFCMFLYFRQHYGISINKIKLFMNTFFLELVHWFCTSNHIFLLNLLLSFLFALLSLFSFFSLFLFPFVSIFLNSIFSLLFFLLYS